MRCCLPVDALSQGRQRPSRGNGLDFVVVLSPTAANLAMEGSGKSVAAAASWAASSSWMAGASARLSFYVDETSEPRDWPGGRQ